MELGEAVRLVLPDLPPVLGVVRWAGGSEIGVSFNECVKFEQLARWIHDRRSGIR
jgi:hypothetical protein